MVNAAKAVSARQRAREASVKFYEREKEREQVQLRYFQAMESVERVYAQRDREIDAVRARAELAAGTAVVDADAAIVALLELRVSRSEIQERLGCSAGDIRRAESTAAVDAEAVDEAAAGAEASAEAVDIAAAVGPAGVDVVSADA
jgi:hypothetical protein